MDVCPVGIWGIGGIGKTTLANAVFNKVSCLFESSYFMHNIREESEKVGGFIRLRQDLVSTILEEGNVNVGTPYIGHTFTKKRFARKKVLIVFDDVTDSSQIESLIGGLELFGLGSRIIITTRDKKVLSNCGVDKIFKVEGLFFDEALHLFSRCAFRQNHPVVGYEELSNEVIKYAKGVPLALKVLGSFLLDRSEEEWKSSLNKLEITPHITIQKVLRISYDGLDSDEKNIFLDIACFFKGKPAYLVKEFLNSCGFSAEIEISVLIDRSLITISDTFVTMHDLLQEMGKEIVRQECISDPGKPSRLWHHKDIYHVLTENTGTEANEGISLDISEIREIMHLNPLAFAMMRKLRFFNIYNSQGGEIKNKVHVSDQDLQFVSKMSYFQWIECPLKSLTPKFRPENLVRLEMRHSNFEQLWDGVQNLVNLK